MPECALGMTAQRLCHRLGGQLLYLDPQRIHVRQRQRIVMPARTSDRLSSLIALYVYELPGQISLCARMAHDARHLRLRHAPLAGKVAFPSMR